MATPRGIKTAIGRTQRRDGYPGLFEQAVASAGERMPHKSTYFFPKPLTGLVMNVMEG